MNQDKILSIVSESISPFEFYCDGYGNPGASGLGYIMGIMMAIGKVKAQFNQYSNTLDSILAFDAAEIENSYLGEINLSYVSSFCGINGVIWGYDIISDPELYHKSDISLKVSLDLGIEVYDIGFLLKAFNGLMGSLQSKHFNFVPGAHVTAAGRHIIFSGESFIYSAIGIGITEKRLSHSILFMEDTGKIFDNSKKPYNVNAIKENIAKNLINSIINIGKQQNITYSKVFWGIKIAKINNGEIGCAMVIAPYFVLAKKAIPNGNCSNMLSYNFTQWEKYSKETLS